MTGGLNILVFALTIQARLARGATAALPNKRLYVLERDDSESLLALLLGVHPLCRYIQELHHNAHQDPKRHHPRWRVGNAALSHHACRQQAIAPDL